ncbi:MAG: hypothetical protein ACI351_05920 [Candidatus Avelusimicrobium sp.]|uniref:hypothetical protein n=1 Tax=Candidatus Avelusimicrobium sp. TaxID=3048833 RepID=UPI003F068BF0
MKTIATDQTNDIFLTPSGDIALATDDVATMQTIRHAVLTSRGELPLDQQAGVPYFNTVFTDAPNLEVFRQEVQRAAEAVETVRSVEDFLMQVQNKTLKYQMRVKLTNGSEVLING